MTPADPGSLEGQLHSVYAEREKLANELGTADADELIAMFRELHANQRPVVEEVAL
ncbi:hypothetical protein [Pengzhenrongella phosphoraccumulans]|uniref:hypothetical protein n=1 Tax=Pengzhenrongella phosphoraccumulans TaxID=3114394 RepID=UPI00388D8342